MADHNGTVTQTLASATQAGSGTHLKTYSVTVAQTLSPIAQAGTATYQGRTATVAQTLSFVAQSGTATFGPDTSTATASQTLSPIAQSGTVETVYFTLVNVATVNETLLVQDKQTLTEVVLTDDSMSAILTETYADAATASDTQEANNYTWLNDNAILASNVVQSASQTTLLSTPARASDKLVGTATAILEDAATATDTQVTGVETSLSSTAYVSELIVQLATLNQIIASTATADSSVVEFTSYSVQETATAASVLTEYVAAAATLSEAATGTEVLTGTLTTFEELLATGTAESVISFDGSALNQLVVSTAEAVGTPWARDYNAVAWVLNTETGGLSSYDNFEFTSITEYGGLLYVTSPEGVFALIGDDDNGRDISAEVRTGFLDFGTEQTKRLSDMFVGYTADGQLECEVETYDGPQEVYTYTMEERDASAPRNNRLKIGRGLSSRYWRFAIKNVDGADFQVYDVAAEVGTSRRRL